MHCRSFRRCYSGLISHLYLYSRCYKSSKLQHYIIFSPLSTALILCCSSPTAVSDLSAHCAFTCSSLALIYPLLLQEQVELKAISHWVCTSSQFKIPTAQQVAENGGHPPKVTAGSLFGAPLVKGPHTATSHIAQVKSRLCCGPWNSCYRKAPKRHFLLQKQRYGSSVSEINHTTEGTVCV